MSFVVATVRIEDFGEGTRGVKEALAMRLEPLGGVRVLRVEVRAVIYPASELPPSHPLPKVQ